MGQESRAEKKGVPGRMRKCDLLLASLGLGLVLFGLLFFDATIRGRSFRPETAVRGRLVRELMLTDLCLFTEARYARHLSQADLHSAFQDYPMSAEHFPAGSLAAPPRTIGALYEKVD